MNKTTNIFSKTQLWTKQGSPTCTKVSMSSDGPDNSASSVFVSISKILLLQVLDFTTIDLTSETDEIPDIIALEEENGSNHSRANDPVLSGQNVE